MVGIDLQPEGGEDTKGEAEYAESIEEAREHIESIHTTVLTELKRITVIGVDAMLEGLGESQYSNSSHFIFELLQNADDNSYGSEIPTTSMRYCHPYFLFQSNELGFRKNDVTSLCTASRSSKMEDGTKSGNSIGEKGIGFKSVFAVSRTVWIKSGFYSFYFTKDVPFGRILPHWGGFPPDSNMEGSENHTSILLKIEDGEQQKLIETLQNLDPMMLLFLRKLRETKIEIYSLEQVGLPQAQTKKIYVHSSRLQVDKIASKKQELLPAKIITGRSSTEASVADLRIAFRYPINARDLPETPMRTGDTEIVLVLPLDPGQAESQNVYAFLPIRDYGFKFGIQADFILVSNRESIQENPYNTFLAERVPLVLLEAIKCLAKREGSSLEGALDAPILDSMTSKLEYEWPLLLPLDSAHKGVFSTLNKIIEETFAEESILRDESGKLFRPKELTSLPVRFMDDHGVPLLPFENSKRNLISLKYPSTTLPNLQCLGLKILSDEEFIWQLDAILSKTPSFFKEKPTTWQNQVCGLLIDLAKIDSLAVIIKRWQIVPTRRGSWISFDSDYVPFFTQEETAVDFPDGIANMIEISPKVMTKQQALCLKLGAKTYSTRTLRRCILEYHQRISASADLSLFGTLENAIQHIRFYYQTKSYSYQILHKWDDEDEPISDLWCVTDTNSIRLLRSVYVHSSERYSASDVARITNLQLDFLHPKYIEVLEKDLSSQSHRPASRRQSMDLSSQFGCPDSRKKWDLSSPFEHQAPTRKNWNGYENLDFEALIKDFWGSSPPFEYEASMKQNRYSPSRFEYQAPTRRYWGLSSPFEHEASMEQNWDLSSPFEHEASMEQNWGLSSPFEYQASTKQNRYLSSRFQDPAPTRQGTDRSIVDCVRDNLGVSTLLRIVANPSETAVDKFEPHPDFRNLAKKYGTVLLNVLSCHWSNYSTYFGGKESSESFEPTNITRIVMNMMVDCHSGEQHKLNSTYLPRQELLELSDVHKLRFCQRPKDTCSICSIISSLQSLEKPRSQSGIIPSEKFLDVENVTDRDWEFLSLFKVSIAPNIHFYFELLKSLQGQNVPHVKVQMLYEKIYQCSIGSGDLSLTQSFFSKGTPLYIPVKPGADEGMWSSYIHCIWDSAVCLKHVPKLRTYYPDQEGLFHEILIKKMLDWDIILREAENLTVADGADHIFWVLGELSSQVTRYMDIDLPFLGRIKMFPTMPRTADFDGASPHTTCDLEQSLNELNLGAVDTLSHSSRTGEHLGILPKLGRVNIVDSSQLVLLSGSCDVEWYIPDNADIREAFAGLIPISRLNARYINWYLQSLRDKLKLESRFLSKCTTGPMIHAISEHEDQPLRLLFRQRILYISALIRDHSKRNNVFRQLELFKVFRCEYISVNWKLRRQPSGVVLESVSKRVTFAAKLDSEMLLYATNDVKPRSLAAKFGKVFAEHYGIEDFKDYMVLGDILNAEDDNEAERIIERHVGHHGFLRHQVEYKKASSNEAEKRYDTGDPPAQFLSQRQKTSDPEPPKKNEWGSIIKSCEPRVSNSRNQKLDHLNAASSSLSQTRPKRKKTRRAKKEIAVNEFEEQSGSSESEGPGDCEPQPRVEQSQHREESLPKESSRGRTTEVKLSPPRNTALGQSRSSPVRDVRKTTYENKDFGELQVSHFLSSLLGEVVYNPNEHWTSTARSRHGHKLYTGSASASTFTITEFDGQLKRMVVDHIDADKRFDATRIKSPCHYHIQVYATYGDDLGRFYLPQRELDKARGMTIDGNGKIENIYILARVIKVGGDHGIFLYLDPWRLYVEGVLSLEARQPYKAEFSSMAKTLVAHESAKSRLELVVEKIYKNQFIGLDQIRLIRLDPNKSDKEFTGSFEITDLKSKTEFVAVSYCWGPRPGPQSRFQFTTTDGQIQITDSLAGCLSRLRDDGISDLIWADAICINQKETMEEARQVSRMGSLYSKAKLVIVWLGVERPEDSQAIEILKRLERSTVADDSFLDDEALQVESLLSREWFGRMWIIQELVLAKSIIVKCGSSEIEWNAFVRGLRQCERIRNQSSIEKSRGAPTTLAGSHRVHALDRTRSLYQQEKPSLYNFLQLRRMFFLNKSSKPRDKLFSLRYLAFDTRQGDNDFNPDYDSLDDQVLYNFVNWMSKFTPIHKLLYWAGDAKSSEISSWIPDLTGQTGQDYYPFPQSISEWRTAKRRFSTGKSILIGESDLSLACLDRPTLFIKGIIFDRVKERSRLQVQHGLEHSRIVMNQFREYVSKLSLQRGSLNSGMESKDEVFIKSLTGDAAGPLTSSARPYFETPNDDTKWQQGFQKEILAIESALIENSQIPQTDVFSQFWATAVTFMQKFPRPTIWLTEKGYFGISPEVEPGDEILLIEGSRVPFVVRKQDGPYNLIGEAYVHGLMYSAEVKTQTKDLRPESISLI